jgi:hypothetical protein
MVVGSFLGEKRLPCLRRGVTRHLGLRLANLGTRACALTPTVSIAIDLSASGLADAIQIDRVSLLGFTVASWNGAVLTLQSQWRQGWWTPGSSLGILFGPVLAVGGSGLVPVSVTVAGTGAWDGVIQVPLFILEPLEAGDETKAAFHWLEGDGFEVSSDPGFKPAQSLSLVLTPPEADQPGTGNVYLVPCLTPECGFTPFGPPQQVCGMSVSLGGAAANRPASAASPFWSFSAPAGSAGAAAWTLTLSGLPTRQPKGAGHMLLVLSGISGIADGCHVVPVSRLPATVTPVITAHLLGGTEITTPLAFASTGQTIYLSWDATGADAVMLTSLDGFEAPGGATFGVVAPVQSLAPVQIEGTSTFVLTACSDNFSSIVSASVTVTVTPDVMTGVFGLNQILAWCGKEADIPAGWQLCDGTAGTPDLTNKFILGASGEVAALVSAPEGSQHTHVFQTVSIPKAPTTTISAHGHALPTSWFTQNVTTTPVIGGTFPSVSLLSGNLTDQPLASNDKHHHTVDVHISKITTGNNNAPVIPPYYALCYIMQVPQS